MCYFSMRLTVLAVHFGENAVAVHSAVHVEFFSKSGPSPPFHTERAMRLQGPIVQSARHSSCRVMKKVSVERDGHFVIPKSHSDIFTRTDAELLRSRDPKRHKHKSGVHKTLAFGINLNQSSCPSNSVRSSLLLCTHQSYPACTTSVTFIYWPQWPCLSSWRSKMMAASSSSSSAPASLRKRSLALPFTLKTLARTVKTLRNWVRESSS